jgi:hypothetical protein
MNSAHAYSCGGYTNKGPSVSASLPPRNAWLESTVLATIRTRFAAPDAVDVGVDPGWMPSSVNRPSRRSAEQGVVLYRHEPRAVGGEPPAVGAAALLDAGSAEGKQEEGADRQEPTHGCTKRIAATRPLAPGAASLREEHEVTGIRRIEVPL